MKFERKLFSQTTVQEKEKLNVSLENRKFQHISDACQVLKVLLPPYKLFGSIHGQTLADRTKPDPSFQL
jgi:hypothetical protein